MHVVFPISALSDHQNHMLCAMGDLLFFSLSEPSCSPHPHQHEHVLYGIQCTTAALGAYMYELHS